MKNSEKRVLATFSDSRMNIDPKFKQQLRSRIVRGQQRRKALVWPKLVMMPAMVVLVLAVAVFAGLQKPEQGQNPFTPQKVSAQDLIQKSDEATKNFDPNKYTFFESTWTGNGGPWFNACASGVGNDTREYVSTTYVYRDHQNKVEALYTSYLKNGQPTPSVSVYDDTDQKILNDYVIPRGTPLSTEIKQSMINGKPGFFVVDRNGNRLSDTSVSPTYLNGREVYLFYTKLNTAVVSPLECWPDGSSRDPKGAPATYLPPVAKPDISKIVLDANTYETLEYSTYVGSVADQNLVTTSSYTFTYQNLSQSEALAIMTKAGFNQNTALHELPGGHD